MTTLAPYTRINRNSIDKARIALATTGEAGVVVDPNDYPQHHRVRSIFHAAARSIGMTVCTTLVGDSWITARPVSRPTFEDWVRFCVRCRIAPDTRMSADNLADRYFDQTGFDIDPDTIRRRRSYDSPEGVEIGSISIPAVINQLKGE